MADEKVYTIPLRKEFSKGPRYKRTAKSVRTVKAYLKRHLKSEFKIGKYLNQELWKHGMKNPPPRIKIKVTKKDDKFYADWINAPEVKEEVKKKTSLKDRLKAKKEPEKKEVKETKPKEEKKTEVKKEEPKETKAEKPKEVKKETPKTETKKEEKK